MTDTRTFDAGLLARGWLATHLATGVDEDTPILYGTLLIEMFTDGARLTATDRTLLLSTWVPCTNAVDEPIPPLDVAPESVTVIRDPDNRGKALLSYLRKLAAKAAKDDQPAPLVTLNIGVPADEGDESGFPGMELEQVVIDYPEHERVALPTVNGTFPDYRTLLLRHESKRTDVVHLGAENLRRLGEVGRIIGGYIRCGLSGTKGAVALEIGEVRGVVMPVAVAEIVSVAS